MPSKRRNPDELNYDDRLEDGFAMLDGRNPMYDIPEDSNGSGIELNEYDRELGDYFG